MTISSTETKTIYGGNGSTGTFAIPFMFVENEDIEVSLTDADGTEEVLVLGTDYQLSGAGDQTGGTCTMTVTPEQGQTLVIRRSPAIVQEVDYLENDAFPAASHEAALDKLTMICQTLSERLDRTITFRVSSAISGVNLPKPDADRFLAWNAAGDNLVNKDVISMGTIMVPVPVSQGGTGADNITMALANLGFGSAGVTMASCETQAEALSAIGAEPADTDILKTDISDLLQAVYGDEAQTHTGTDLSGLTVARNHISWHLAADSQFSDVPLPYDGTYVFHIYPASHGLSLGATYKRDNGLTDPDGDAGEIRIVVEQYNSRKSIISLQNMEA